MKKLVLLILLVLLVLSTFLIAGCEPKCTKVVRTNKGCDQMEGCRCLHESWGGLGSCDSCECTECK